MNRSTANKKKTIGQFEKKRPQEKSLNNNAISEQAHKYLIYSNK